MGSLELGAVLADFASAFQQQNRLLRLTFGGAGPAANTLLPYQLSGHEQLSHCYRYQLDCLAIDAALELKTLLGLPLHLEILTADGATRPLSGIVSAAQALPSNGGFAAYRLIIEPGLALLGLRRTSRVFQAKSVPEIVQAILAEHQALNPVLAQSLRLELQLEQTHAPRSYCVQHRETDLAFIQRLLAEEGIGYRFAFSAERELPSHTLVLFDDAYALPAASQRHVRFHRADGTEREDTVFEWAAQRQLVPAQSSLASYDYKPAAALAVSEDSFLQHGPAGAQAMRSLEDYRPQTHYYASDLDGHSRYGKLRQHANDLFAKTFHGQSNVRGLTAGEWFQLDQHPAHANDAPEQRQFVVLGVQLYARNNLPAKLRTALPSFPRTRESSSNLMHEQEQRSEAPYRNRFSAVRRGVAIVPGYDSLNPIAEDTLLAGLSARHAKPSAPGPQTATVVGPAGEVVYTDQLGRVCVQFHWQRPHEHPDGSANFDDKSSTWLRVATPSAGAGFGSQFIPRIGQEVLVEFLDGDIDRPIVSGVIHNGSHAVPNFSGVGSLPANKTLSGIKSEEHGGGQYGELLFDDTPGQVRTKLSSEHGKTQLNLGYLTHPRTDGVAEARGDGFELRTDRHGAIRAGHGLLLSAEAKTGAAGRQLDREQALSQLSAAQALAAALGETASHQLADRIETGPQAIASDNQPQGKASQGHHDHLTQAVKSWAKGTNTKDASGDAPGQQPILLVTAPAGIALTTPDALVLSSGKNLDSVSQRDTQQTTARRWLHNVGEKISLFVDGVKDKANLKLITAKGHAQLHAQDGDVEIAGDKNLRLYANKEKLQLAAGQELLLTCGGAYIRLAGGKIEIHAPGKVSYKGSKHDFGGPAKMDFPLPKFLDSLTVFDEQMKIESPLSEQLFRGYKYKMTLEDNPEFEGTLNKDGKTERVFTKKPMKIKSIELSPGKVIDLSEDSGTY